MSDATPEAAGGADPALLARQREARAAYGAQFVPAGAGVLHLGCGTMAFEKFLPLGCRYLPCDRERRDHRTILCDLNAAGPPRKALAEADIVVLLGALE